MTLKNKLKKVAWGVVVAFLIVYFYKVKATHGISILQILNRDFQPILDPKKIKDKSKDQIKRNWKNYWKDLFK